MKRAKTVEVWSIVYDVPAHSGGMTDSIEHFRDPSEAQSFAAGKTLHGRPITLPPVTHVPVSLAKRWGVA